MPPVEEWEKMIFNWQEDFRVRVFKDQRFISMAKNGYLVGYEITPEGAIGYFQLNKRRILKTYIHSIQVGGPTVNLVKGNISASRANTAKTELDKILKSTKKLLIFSNCSGW
jgi:hypothetical protein